MRSNSTILVKKKMLSCGHFDYNFSKGRCKQCATVQSTQRRIADIEEKEDTESLQNLVEDLDAIFSRFIRLSYLNEQGLIKCFTCSKKLPLAQMQNGHYISRAIMVLRFEQNNCRPQCPYCNSHHEINEVPFTESLEKETPGITSYLKTKAREVYKYTRDELKSLIAEYRFKMKLLEKRNKK